MLHGATQLQLGATAPSRRPVYSRALDDCRIAEARMILAPVQHRAWRDDTILDKAPQRDGQLSGDSNNPDFAAASALLSELGTVPCGELARWLMYIPGPSDLDKQRARRLVTGFADP